MMDPILLVPADIKSAGLGVYLDQINSGTNVMTNILGTFCTWLERLEKKIDDTNTGFEERAGVLESKLAKIVEQLADNDDQIGGSHINEFMTTLPRPSMDPPTLIKPPESPMRNSTTAMELADIAKAVLIRNQNIAPLAPNLKRASQPVKSRMRWWWAYSQVLLQIRTERFRAHERMMNSPGLIIKGRFGTRVANVESAIATMQAELDELRRAYAASTQTGRDHADEIEHLREVLGTMGGEEAAGMLRDVGKRVQRLETSLDTQTTTLAKTEQKVRTNEEHIAASGEQLFYAMDQLEALKQSAAGAAANVKKLYGALLEDREVITQLKDLTVCLRETDAAPIKIPDVVKIEEEVVIVPVKFNSSLTSAIVSPAPRMAMSPSFAEPRESDEEKQSRLLREALVALRDLSVDIDSSVRSATPAASSNMIQTLRNLSISLDATLSIAAVAAQDGVKDVSAVILPKIEDVMLQVDAVLAMHEVEKQKSRGQLHQAQNSQPVGLSSLRCANGVQEMPECLVRALDALCSAAGAYATPGRLRLALLHVVDDLKKAASRDDLCNVSDQAARVALQLADMGVALAARRASNPAIGRKEHADLASLAMKADVTWVEANMERVWNEIRRHHPEGSDLVPEIDARPSTANFEEEYLKLREEDKARLKDLSASVASAMLQLERMNAEISSKAESDQLDTALKVVNLQLRKISTDTMPRDKLEGYLKSKVDKQDLNKLAAVLAGAMDNGPAPANSVGASRVCHKFRCLSCDRPLPSGTNGTGPHSHDPTHPAIPGNAGTEEVHRPGSSRHTGEGQTVMVDGVLVMDGPVMSRYPRMMPPPNRQRTAVGGGAAGLNSKLRRPYET